MISVAFLDLNIKYYYRLLLQRDIQEYILNCFIIYYLTAKILVIVINSEHEYSYTLNKIFVCSCGVGEVAMNRHPCRNLWRPEGGIVSLEAEVTSNCELSDVDNQNQTQGLC